MHFKLLAFIAALATITRAQAACVTILHARSARWDTTFVDPRPLDRPNVAQTRRSVGCNGAMECSADGVGEPVFAARVPRKKAEALKFSNTVTKADQVTMKLERLAGLACVCHRIGEYGSNPPGVTKRKRDDIVFQTDIDESVECFSFRVFAGWKAREPVWYFREPASMWGRRQGRQGPAKIMGKAP
ncbi:hypothetical protein FB451DRAFT_1163769 [Mycena latifolia]|nr:hypothetical protein FB451DRAFT_1163769 [Mycena latifolia]